MRLFLVYWKAGMVVPNVQRIGFFLTLRNLQTGQGESSPSPTDRLVSFEGASSQAPTGANTSPIETPKVPEVL